MARLNADDCQAMGLIGRIIVLLDGEDVTEYCTLADEEEGMVERYAISWEDPDAIGFPYVVVDDNLVRKKYYGKVEIVIKKERSK